MLIYSRYVFINVKTYCLKNSRRRSRSIELTTAVCLPHPGLLVYKIIFFSTTSLYP